MPIGPKGTGLAAFLLGSVFLGGSPALAQNQWVGPNPDFQWNTGTNWTLGEPTSGQSVGLTINGAASSQTVIYNNDVNPTPSLNSLVIEGVGLDAANHPLSMTLQQNALALSISGDLSLGNSANGTGIYALGGGGTLTAGRLIAGSEGTGLVTQSGGTATIANDLLVGGAATALGTYSLSGTGQLSTGRSLVGSSGTGSFTQSGAGTQHLITGDLEVGQVKGSSGTYTLSSGVLKSNRSFVGEQGTGEIDQSGGSNTVAGNLSLGNGATGTGAYKLSGSGQLTVGGDLNVGLAAGATGTYALSDGGHLATGRTIVGSFGTGSFTQSGNGSQHTVGGDLEVGFVKGSSGDYTLHDGQFSVGRAFIGDHGNGTFHQDGGTYTVGSVANPTTLVLAQAIGSTGEYDLRGGALTVNGIERIGRRGVGTFNQSGGSNVVTGTVLIKPNATATGTFNLSGGSFQSQGGVTNGDTLNFSGGSFTSDLDNQAKTTLSGAGTRTITGNVLNEAGATFKVSGTTAAITGTFTNNGAFVSDPSTTKFNNLTVGTTGFLKGGPGDVFSIAGNFVNHSTQNTIWLTNRSTLTFTGIQAHELDFVGTDRGRSRDIGLVNNFAFGELSLALGDVIDVVDGTGSGNVALYVEGFDLAGHDLSELQNIKSDFNIYYDPTLAENAYLGGRDFALDGKGELLATVAEPAPVAGLGFGLACLIWLRRRVHA